jgi:protein TonB
MKEAPAKPTPAPAPETPSATPSAAAAAPLSSSETAAPPKPLAAAAAETRADDAVSADALERLRYTAPEYPAGARAAGTSGWVNLAFDVEPDGSVTHVVVLGAEPKNVFDAAAVSAVRRWRYRPAERDGHPIEQRAKLRIRFTLQ